MKEKIYSVIEEAINEINEDLDEKLIFSKNAELMSSNSVLDSFALVNLILVIESNISSEFNKNISLVNDSAFSMKNSPFLSTKTLCEYICTLLENK